jgi:hypothetical protein
VPNWEQQDPHDVGGVGSTPAQFGRVLYDAGYPGRAVTLADQHVSHQDDIGDTSWPVTEADYSTSRYINYSVGGTTGTVNRNGWTNGLWWHRVPFRGSPTRAVMRDLGKDAHGPVGRSNYAQALQAGVAEQFTVPPTLEQIYRSFTGG